MLREEILWSDQGILAMGRKGEDTYGRRNFLELFSVFISPPLFTILHGRQELGSVDQMTFLEKKDGPRVLLLGGRAWLVTHIDWKRKLAYVEATEARGRSRWKGSGQGIGHSLSRAIHRVLISEGLDETWSQRTRERVAEIRHEYSWLNAASSVVLLGLSGGSEWWTFAGSRANGMLANELSSVTTSRVEHDDFALTFESRLAPADIEGAIGLLRTRTAESLRPLVDESAITGLKFSDCLPRNLALSVLEKRLADVVGAQATLSEHVTFTSCDVV